MGYNKQTSNLYFINQASAADTQIIEAGVMKFWMQGHIYIYLSGGLTKQAKNTTLVQFH